MSGGVGTEPPSRKLNTRSYPTVNFACNFVHVNPLNMQNVSRHGKHTDSGGGGCILLILPPVSAPEHPGRFLLRSQETIETASPVFDVISQQSNVF